MTTKGQERKISKEKKKKWGQTKKNRRNKSGTQGTHKEHGSTGTKPDEPTKRWGEQHSLNTHYTNKRLRCRWRGDTGNRAVLTRLIGGRCVRVGDQTEEVHRNARGNTGEQEVWGDNKTRNKTGNSSSETQTMTATAILNTSYLHILNKEQPLTLFLFSYES